MAVANFKNIHSAIKSKITDRGFVYVPSDRWFNLDVGIFPEALKNNSFTIKFSSLDDSEYSSDWGLINVQIEFILEAMKDKYLNKMDDCSQALEDTKSVADSDIKIADPNGFENFTSNYLGDRVIFTYNLELNILTRS